MRYLSGVLCALALGMLPLVGCSDPEGPGGSGGSAGTGGTGGDGGSAGTGGMGGFAGTGGTGGMRECLMGCDDMNECTEDVCTDGMCIYTALADNTECDFDGLPGLCMSGLCEGLCRRVDCDDENLCTDDACDPADGVCDYIPVDCDDGNECTEDACDAADGLCSHTAVEDGTSCGDGARTCQAGSCVGTFPCTEAGIREAIAVGGGPHTFDCIGPTTVVTDAEIVIDNDVILDGEGNLAVDGNESHRVFYVAQSVTAELRGFTVTRGAVHQGSGAGIYVGGRTLTLTNSTVSGNQGGGIYNGFGRTLTLTNSTVSGNDGFGIANLGSATLTNTTISGNSEGSLVVVCILHFLFDCGRFRLINSTVSGDTACQGEMGFECDEPEAVNVVTWMNTVIDGVCRSPRVAASNGYNIESPGNTCGFDEAKGDQFDVTEAQLNLGPLQNNGGPIMTHKPGDGGFGSGSAAIDQIPEADCEVTTDQRGEPRPAGPDPKRCDVGSVEVQEGSL